MIKQASVMSRSPKAQPYYEVTASLLNSWQRIFDAAEWARESEDKSLEQAQEEAMESAKAEFIDVLSRKPIPDTEAMKKGREYEESVYKGEDIVFSEVVENGEFQAAYKKPVNISGMNIMLYGILDCLKAGRIYDIKRVGYYQSRKYKGSHQHPMYFELVPNAIDFTYLVCDDKGVHHFERYERCNCEDVKDVVAQFLSWLEANDLMQTFKEKWDWGRKKHRI